MVDFIFFHTRVPFAELSLTEDFSARSEILEARFWGILRREKWGLWDCTAACEGVWCGSCSARWGRGGEFGGCYLLYLVLSGCTYRCVIVCVKMAGMRVLLVQIA